MVNSVVHPCSLICGFVLCLFVVDYATIDCCVVVLFILWLIAVFRIV